MMEELQKIADPLQQESETFKTLAASAEGSGDVRLPPSTSKVLAKRMSESLRKIAKD